MTDALTIGAPIGGVRIREMTTDPTGRWLALAWSDMRRAPAVSLGYGLLCVAASWMVTLAVGIAGNWFLLLPMLGAFMLLAPLGAVGLYEVSRRIEERQPVTLIDAVAAPGRNIMQLALLGLILMLFVLAWVRLAMLIFALFFGLEPPSSLYSMLFAVENLPFLIISNAIGAVLAALVFAMSAVSVPLLLDRKLDVVTAVAASVVACRTNWRVMIGWAALIVLLTGAGVATFYLGLAVTLPLVGHATWHAYRDLIVREDKPG